MNKLAAATNDAPNSAPFQVAAVDDVTCNDTAAKINEKGDANDQHTEKCDISPENFEKSSCDITPVDDESTSVSAMSARTTANEMTTSEMSLSMTEKGFSDDKTCDSDGKSKMAASGMAFTIDFNEGRTIDNRKYKEIVERFQNRQQRHRRGVSLSKLDDTRKSSSSLNNAGRCSPVVADMMPVATKPPMKVQRPRIDADLLPATAQRTVDDKSVDQVATVKVALRRRPLQSQQQFEATKDASKRHSWSPRSSLNYDALPQVMRQTNVSPAEEQSMRTEKPTPFQPKSTTLQRALEQTARDRQNVTSPKTTKSPDSFENQVTVVTEPLEYVRQSDESVSDAGTYTLDGDNYTEEEKERMSIDKLARKNRMATAATTTTSTATNRNQTYLKLRTQPQAEISVGNTQRSAHEKRASSVGAKNVLEVNFDQSSSTSKTAKVSYLDRIKSRVKTIGDRTFHKSKSPAPNYRSKTIDSTPNVAADHGTFTSITACGVLNKFGQHEPAAVPSKGAHRKNSLTKLQIDSSEYIQPKYNIDEKVLNSYTDYEKAKHCEYQLNIFSTAPSYASNTDDDNLSFDCGDEEELSIKTAPTKNDWIQEWAKNARRRNSAMAAAATNGSPQHSQDQRKSNGLRTKSSIIGNRTGDQRMTKSYDYHYNHPNDYDANEFGDDIHPNVDDSVTHFSRSSIRNSLTNGYETKRQSTSALRPPISPTKIPSPVHTQLRGRSSSANRSFRNSNVDLDNLETEMFLEKTAAAISSLQKIHRENNSPKSPSSPMRSTAVSTEFGQRNTYDKAIDLRPMHLHKRNFSLDVTQAVRKLHANQENSGQYAGPGTFDAQIQERMQTRHTRHNSYENQTFQLNSPRRSSIDQTILLAQQLQSKSMFTEQQTLLNKYFDDEQTRIRTRVGDGSGGGDVRRTVGATGSPIGRSSSFCHKNQTNASKNVTKKSTVTTKRGTSSTSGNALQKSASSSSFKKILSTSSANQPLNDNDDEAKFYVNDEDEELHAANDVEYNLIYSSDESDIDATNSNNNKYESDAAIEPPISHTRYNKAFLMRMEQNKQIAGTGTMNSAESKGLQAFPNTPEMHRRTINPRASFRERTSMPRDSSMSRMKQGIPNLQTTKKALAQLEPKDSSSSISSGNKQRVLPKYMDISKYKPAQGQNFLKRDETKSTLINRSEIRKSPSAIGLSKADTTRSSGRIKSAGAKPNTPVNIKGNFALRVSVFN